MLDVKDQDAAALIHVKFKITILLEAAASSWFHNLEPQFFLTKLSLKKRLEEVILPYVFKSTR